MLRALALGLGLATLVLAAPPAFAEGRRVVVLGFKGPRPQAAQLVVEHTVGDNHTLVSAKTYKTRAANLRAKRMSAAHILRVAADLQVDAIVAGSIAGRRGRQSLRLVVYEGKTGRALDSITIPVRGRGVVDERAVADRLLPVIDRAAPIEPGPEAAAEVDSAPAAAAPAATETEAPLPPDELSLEDAGGPKDVSDGSSRLRSPGAEVDAGVSVTMRTLGFSHNLATGLQRYRGAPVPGAYVHGELYPLAFGRPNAILSGLGVAFVIDRVLRVRSRLESGGPEYASSSLRWEAGLRFRIHLGPSPSRPTLKLGVSYGHLDFLINGDDTVELPDVSYDFIAGSLAARVPLGSRRLAASAEAKYLQMLSVGAIEDMTSYGPGTTRGLDFDVGIEYRLLPRLALKLGARYTRVALEFDGTGDLAHAQDTDPEQDVAGARDRYIGGYATAGYTF